MILPSGGRILLALTVVIALTGATCVPRPPAESLPPPLFQSAPTLEELASVLNSSASRVRQLHTEGATITTARMPGFLRAEITLERPRRFRLRGRLMGPALDIGSNDELLWFWASNDPENNVYFARHDQVSAGVNSPIPLEPEWLVDAFGLVELAPQDFHEGPFPRGSQQVEVISRLWRPRGELVRRLVIHPSYGWILEQQVYSSSGQLLASVRGSNHVYHEEVGVSLPHRIDIELPPSRLNFTVEVDQYAINQLFDAPATIWAMPLFEGQPRIDLTAGSVPFPGHAPQPLGPYESRDRTSFRPRYRGDSASERFDHVRF